MVSIRSDWRPTPDEPHGLYSFGLSALPEEPVSMRASVVRRILLAILCTILVGPMLCAQPFEVKVITDSERIAKILTSITAIEQRLTRIESDVANLRNQIATAAPPQYSCVSGLISKNMTTGEQEVCSPYRCKSIDGRCTNPPFCRTSDDCEANFSCNSAQQCVATPQNRTP